MTRGMRSPDTSCIKLEILKLLTTSLYRHQPFPPKLEHELGFGCISFHHNWCFTPGRIFYLERLSVKKIFRTQPCPQTFEKLFHGSSSLIVTSLNSLHGAEEWTRKSWH